MEDVMTTERIKETRGKYGLSQRSFAKLLGIGEATIVRYENGAKPNKANANLLRAAEDPRFMRGCLERDGGRIPASQRKKASKYVYAYIQSDEGEPEMDMNEMYDLTLRQEVLTEKASNITWALINFMSDNDIDIFAETTSVSQLYVRIAKLKPKIVSMESLNDKTLDDIEDFLDFAQTYASELPDKKEAA